MGFNYACFSCIADKSKVMVRINFSAQFGKLVSTCEPSMKFRVLEVTTIKP